MKQDIAISIEIHVRPKDGLYGASISVGMKGGLEGVETGKSPDGHATPQEALLGALAFITVNINKRILGLADQMRKRSVVLAKQLPPEAN